ncbi:MAG: DNA-binding transcriptional regulator [Firmicutes bacterium]|jgi:TrpR-related protein YerC/YecD|nr:DNA-binding transcriptional regulator [Bacillota bacterium]
MAYEPKWRDELTDQLCLAFAALETPEESARLLEDICTIGEIQALAQRLEAARMLRAGYTYEHITARTGMSTATISRVKKFLNYGADGYKLILDRLEERGDLPPLPPPQE